MKQIGVIGDHNLAKVVTQRLLFCNYHVKISNQLFRDQVMNYMNIFDTRLYQNIL